jgi:hypothetical protein
MYMPTSAQPEVVEWNISGMPAQEKVTERPGSFPVPGHLFLPQKFAIVRPYPDLFGTFNSDGFEDLAPGFRDSGGAPDPVSFSRVKPPSTVITDVDISTTNTEHMGQDEPIAGKPWSLSLNSDRKWRCSSCSGE